jgi:hypothetical protein
MNAQSGQGHVVKKSKFTEKQIAFALKRAELVPRVVELRRKTGYQRGDRLHLEEALRRCRSV